MSASTSAGSVRFDRAAEFYDRTRAVGDAVMAATVELLAEELAGRGRVLEIGVGTGLLALPLRAAGVDVWGFDLSPAMVAKLVEKADGSPPPLVLADATGMPFRDASFGAAYLRWVLHLIPGWREVIEGTVRTVAPGGIFLACLGTYDEVSEAIRSRFGEIVGISLDPVGLGSDAAGELDAAMRALGAEVRELAPIVDVGEEVMGGFLDGIRDNVYSWTWVVPEGERLRAADELRTWTEQRFGPLDEPRGYEYATVWRAYDLP